MKEKYQLKAKWDDICGARDGDYKNPILRAKDETLGFLLGEADPITDEDMKTPKTDEDLDKLIAVLKAERENIPEYSAFGDPNWRIIDAQIEICEWAKGSK